MIPACRTSLSDIFAVGDCALHESGFAQGAEIRLESVQNAADMAGVVVKTLMGETASYDAVPWFWSNQYDLKLQTVGLASGYDETVVRGHPSEGGFSVIYLRDGQVIALDCVNAVRDYVQGRALVRARSASVEICLQMFRSLSSRMRSCRAAERLEGEQVECVIDGTNRKA